jgi:hypothetical protein
VTGSAHRATRGPAGGAPVRPALVVLVTLALTLVALVGVLPHLRYGLHGYFSSDVGNYQSYADAIGQGLKPYLDFDVEYPPLAVPLFRLPGAGIPIEIYKRRFSIEMGVAVLLAGRPRRWVWPLVGFAAAALAGFWPYLFTAPRGVWYVFQYHLQRPLQLESVLGAPMMLGQALGADWVEVGASYGSQQLIARGADLAADLSGVLTFGALVVVYVVIMRRRAHLRAAPYELPLAVLTLLLALLAFGKVLSPQYFIWLVPVLALVAAKDWLLGTAGGVLLAMTQAEYPTLWGHVSNLDRPFVALLVARNLLLVATFVAAVWRLAGWGSTTNATQDDRPRTVGR